VNGKAQNSGDSSDVIVNLASLLTLKDQEDDLGIWSQVDAGPVKDVERRNDQIDGVASVEKSDANFDEVVGNEDFNSVPVLSISDAGQTFSLGPKSTEWAEQMDVSQPIPDFHQKVPQMAYTW
jgi:hypothetical protein